MTSVSKSNPVWLATVNSADHRQKCVVFGGKPNVEEIEATFKMLSLDGPDESFWTNVAVAFDDGSHAIGQVTGSDDYEIMLFFAGVCVYKIAITPLVAVRLQGT